MDKQDHFDELVVTLRSTAASPCEVEDLMACVIDEMKQEARATASTNPT